MKFHFILFPFHPPNLYPHPSLHVLVFLFLYSLLIREWDREEQGESVERESPSFLVFISFIDKGEGEIEGRDREIEE